MKLRLEKSKITIRLSTSEIADFSASKNIEEKVIISDNNHFTFALKICDSCHKLFAEFKDGGLVLHVPTDDADQWLNSKRIGIHETTLTNDGDNIKLIVEEDLPRRKSIKKG